MAPKLLHDLGIFAILGRFNEAEPSSVPLRTSRDQVLRPFSGRYAVADISQQLVDDTVPEGDRAEAKGFAVLGFPG